jgi:hypothetical protein
MSLNELPDFLPTWRAVTSTCSGCIDLDGLTMMLLDRVCVRLCLRLRLRLWSWLESRRVTSRHKYNWEVMYISNVMLLAVVLLLRIEISKSQISFLCVDVDTTVLINSTYHLQKKRTTCLSLAKCLAVLARESQRLSNQVLHLDK